MWKVEYTYTMGHEVKDTIINVLDDGTANRIAAGEVVERPASVVKELVENALDAGANEITVELQDGGKRVIRVTDNGMGMSRTDATLCLLRHATSKICTADDLFSILTLGFRGEAMPSIASVCRLEIVTRREEDDAGTLVVCEGGEVTEVSDVGTPVGTCITVSDLFFNVPARQKFLKTAQTELGHSLELINRFIISHSGVNFTFLHNDRTILKSPGSDRLQDAILTVFGRDAAEAVIPILGRSGPYKVHGFVSRPSYSKQNRSGQLFYVNRRFVRNRNMIHALDDAYRGILPQGRFPLIVAFVDVDPELVDVNVHPTKIEVKFVKEWEVHNLMASSVRDALASSSVAPTGDDFLPRAGASIERPDFARHDRFESEPRYTTATMQDLVSFREALAAKLDTGAASSPTMPGQNMPAAVEVAPEQGGVEAAESDILAGTIVLAQARNMYIVAQTPSGILLLDQHIVHERILYDRLSGQGGGVEIQRLMIPVTLALGKRESLVLENKLSDLQAMGFEIEPFGKETFVVRGIPALIAEKNYEQILRDTIDELTELTLAKRLMVHKDAVIATTACKMAVKAGERLSMEEMTRLVAELRQTSNPYLCPHGRPIVVRFSNRELDKMFGRA